ncbi:hypothetical protein [Mycolicibacterium cosmeticum]|uniref:Uncharacterized protein n=1 Tax=Mycolicibacterium cosmeticum TaxID=258533 RepID=W9AZR7_MYCCO|nr:hypothetical protein [Mycolicibacterium cosmeticum]CDO08056.1 hypothetical protein BN977_02875 [Mycolicibacterium cosmeticum]
MLGYRTFFNVERQSQLIGLVEGQLHSWMKTKGWSYDNLVEGTVVDVARDTRCAILGEQLQDGSRTRRFRFLQDGQGGKWITELTYYQSRNDDGWVWLEIEQPEGTRRAGTPRLAKMLVEVLAVRDGDNTLTPQPMPTGASEVDDVIAAVTDPNRRGLLFVSGSSDSDIPLVQWNGFVSGILRETVGLSSAYLLDPEATEAFNSRISESHRVSPYTVRTYRPQVQLDEQLDSERHRILTTNAIIKDDPRWLQRLLGNRARETAISTSLPSPAHRVDRRLRDALDILLLDRTSSATAEKLVDLPEAAQQPAVTASPDHVTSVLQLMLRQLLGNDAVTDDSLRRLGQLALDGKVARQASDDARQRLATLENQVDSGAAAVRRLTERLEDEQLERAQSEEENTEMGRQIRFLQTKLASMGSQDGWVVPDKTQSDTAPGSFGELFSRLNEFEHIVFTGDSSHALELDDHEVLGTWAAKCWRALLALEDYVEWSRSGKFSGSVETYLNSTPAGAHGFPAKRHASSESEDVGKNPKYWRPRTLPVPTDVDSAGVVYMESHFKIAQSGLISPRMHYFDDNSRTGKIYVGYVGRHLPTQRTN